MASVSGMVIAVVRRAHGRLEAYKVLLLVVFGAVALSSLTACSNRGSSNEGSQNKLAVGEQAQDRNANRTTLGLPRYPATIRGKFGTSSTSAYRGHSPARLSDAPYGPSDGRIVADYHSFAGLSGPTDLARQARVVVRGTVTAIGPPHFNSDEGSFWDPALHDEPGITDVANVIIRDIQFHVEEVLGKALYGIEIGSSLRFISLGGQVQVTLSEETAAKLELGSAGTYIFSSEPPVDLVEGEEAVLFLNAIPFDGLYNGQYGYRFELYPAHELYYKYTIDDGRMVNAYDAAFNLTVTELKDVIGGYLALSAGPEPQEGIFSATPHPPVEGGSPPDEQTEPPHDHGEG